MTTPPPPPPATPAGWYPDPNGAPTQRYWDGAQWTEHQAGSQTPPPPATKKKGSKGKIILGVLAAVVLLIIIASVAGGGGDDKDTAATTAPAPTGTSAAPPSAEAPPAADPPASGGSEITYEVQSDGPLSTVTYFDEINDMKQLSDQPSNWSTSFEGKATFQMHSMSAQTTGTQVSCRILVGGEVLAEQSATGRYAVVTCAG